MGVERAACLRLGSHNKFWTIGVFVVLTSPLQVDGWDSPDSLPRCATRCSILVFLPRFQIGPTPWKLQVFGNRLRINFFHRAHGFD